MVSSVFLSLCHPECLWKCHSRITDDNPLFVASNGQKVPGIASRSPGRGFESTGKNWLDVLNMKPEYRAEPSPFDDGSDPGNE
jgi:hypothetical protein